MNELNRDELVGIEGGWCIDLLGPTGLILELFGICVGIKF